MADARGFLRHQRHTPPRRPVPVRIQDWREVYARPGEGFIRDQASRCMDCGIPFCHSTTAGCPLGNRIPEWNDLVRTGQWETAAAELHATNNFPEFTGRLCPAPCEAACVLGIADAPVTIKNIEQEIADQAWDSGWVTPASPARPTGRRVAVVGSGPAGLAAAQQLTRVGHAVTVYERDDALGGLLRYGIPDFKLEKHHIDRRVAQLRTEGVGFVTDCDVGADISIAALREASDAVLLATGALAPRDTVVPGRELAGIHQAMDHLVGANRAQQPNGPPAPIDAAGKHVVIIGGGDTAADCLGVAHRQGAHSVVQLDRYPEPPSERDETRDPWPTWPWLLRSYPAHEEGGDREFAVAVQEFVGDDQGQVRAVRVADVVVQTRVDGTREVQPVPGTTRDLPADLVLLAIGFAGTDARALADGLGVSLSATGVATVDDSWQTTSDGVFAAGDLHRGASLIVWAIAEGRAAAAAIDAYLATPSTPAAGLPALVAPPDQSLR